MLYAGIPRDAANKESSTGSASALSILTFEDGLGWRYRVETGVPHKAQPEILCFGSSFTDISSFEAALRERVAVLSSFRHESFARIRSVSRLNDELSNLGLVSDFIPGVRLSEVLAEAEQRALPFDIGAALSVIRQLVSAVAFLHQHARVAHGALGPERVLITRDAHVFILEYALGSALEQLRFSRERYWRDLGVALPPSAGIPRLDEFADITQIGAIALSLVLGRPLRKDEYLEGLDDLVASACAQHAPGWSNIASSGLRDWLRRMLQLDRDSFTSLVTAGRALDEILTAGSYNPDHSALEFFLARYHASEPPVRPGAAPLHGEMQPLAGKEAEKSQPIRTGYWSRRRQPPKWMLVSVVLTAAAGAILAGQRDFFTMGTLKIDTNRPGALVFVDGVQRGQTPAEITLNAGQHTLEIRADGETRTVQVAVAAGAVAAQYLELPNAKALGGQLQVSTGPTIARVSVDGQPRGNSPLTLSDLTPGEHVVTLESEFGSVTQKVQIEAGQSASLVVPLASKAGWVRILAPADMQLYERGRLLGSSQIDRIMLPAGKHEIEILNYALGYRSVRTVNVSPEKTSVVTLDLPNGILSLNATPWAGVWIDGENVGETPIGNLPVRIGDHEVVFRNPQLGEQRRIVTVTLHSPTRVSLDLTR